MPTPAQQDVIRRLAEARLVSGAELDASEAIRATGGVPVYAWWTGFTLVTPDGAVLFYDEEKKVTESVLDKKERRFAFKRLAELDLSLQSLAPVRPVSARDCAQCGGKGEVRVGNDATGRIEADCGECGGVGWLD